MKSEDPLESLLTREQVAKILSTSLKTVDRRIESGDLPMIRDRRIVPLRPVGLRRYIAQRRFG